MNVLHPVQTYHSFLLTNLIQFIPQTKKESFHFLNDSLSVYGMHVTYKTNQITFSH